MTQFKAGDLIYWMGNPLAKFGSAAAFTVVPEANADFVPQGLDVFSAASLPLCVNTAYQVCSQRRTGTEGSYIDSRSAR